MLQQRTMIILALIILAALGGLVWWKFFPAALQKGSAGPYIDARDREDVIKVFTDNYYLLNCNPYEWALPEFLSQLDAETRPDSERPYNTLRFSVYRKGGKTIGFVAYNLLIENMREGKLLYLAVDKDARGQGVGSALIKEAIRQLRAHGAQLIKVVTTTNNKITQKLYPAIGFKEVSRDLEYVYYEMGPEVKA